MRRSKNMPQTGQDLVEFALALPVLLLLLIGVFQFGVLAFSYNTLANAAREGARLGSVTSGASSVGPVDCKSTHTIVQGACALTGGLKPESIQVQVTVDGRVRVDMSYDAPVFTALIPSLPGPTFKLHASASMQQE